MQLTRDAARRVCASFAPAHRILIPLHPLTGHQSVSQSLSLLAQSVSLRPALLRPLSRSYPGSLVLSHGFPSLSALSIPPSRPLISRPRTHTRTFFLFYAGTPYRCSCLLTHSLLQFFHRPPRPTRAACRVLFFLPFARNYDRASIHPPDFSLFHPTPLSSPFWSLRLSVFRFSLHRDRSHGLHHISNLTRILSAAVSQTLKSFLGN